MNNAYDWGYEVLSFFQENKCAPVECSPGCPSGWPGDAYCDNACNVAACNFDDGDCSHNQ